MASLRFVAAVLVCIIVCQLGLNHAFPVDEIGEDSPERPFDESEVDSLPENQKSVNASDDIGIQNVITTLSKLSTKPTEPPVPSSVSTVTSLVTGTTASSTVITTTNATTAVTPAPTAQPEEVLDGSQQDNEEPSNNLKDETVIKAPKEEIRFWWSDSTILSVVIPVTVGLGSALFIITWVCCIRWMCCRRCRTDNYRLKVSPHQRTLREDFRQLRQKDRAKLLAETSDDEF